MAEAEAHRMSILSVLLREGGPQGFGIVVLGLVLTLWGLINLALVRNRGMLVAQAFLAFLPLGVAFLAMCNGLSAFLELASAAGPPPRPELIAQTAVYAIANGIFGATATAVPAIIGIAALSKNRSSPKQSQSTPKAMTSDR